MPLWARDAVSEVTSAKETFSSWDKCMQKAYCKWPVIVGIVIGCLILIGIAWCLISCLCCGVQCCKGCADCCSCCCSCGSSGSGGGGGHHRSKYADDPAPYHAPPAPPPPPTYGYQSPPPPGPPTYRGAQFARFDVPSNTKVNDDALPAMPTWEGAITKKVEDTSPHPENVEMNRLDPPGQQQGIAPGAGRQTRGGYIEIPSSSPASPQPGYQPGYRGVEEPSARSRSPRSPIDGPFASGGPGVAAAVAAPTNYGQQQYGGRNSPYENRPPTSSGRTPNFHTPRPYQQIPSPVSPVSPPLEQPPYPVDQPGPSPLSQPRLTSPSPSPLDHPRGPSSPVNEHLPTQSPPPPQPQQTYTAYNPQPQSAYTAYSPNTSSSPPPQVEDPPSPGRPPSVLQVGRKPVPGSWRDV